MIELVNIVEDAEYGNCGMLYSIRHSFMVQAGEPIPEPPKNVVSSMVRLATPIVETLSPPQDMEPPGKLQPVKVMIN